MSVALFEAPLIHQRKGAGEQYVVQRPAAHDDSAFSISLTGQELGVKASARAEIYTLLVKQMGHVITDLPPEHLAREVIVPARPIGSPADDVVLRYEWRAELLRAGGQIREPITFEHHFLPVARSRDPA
jgi:hypothetical protein